MSLFCSVQLPLGNGGKVQICFVGILLLWPCVSKSFLLGILTRCIYFGKHITIFIYSNKWYPWKGNSQQQCSACWLYHLLMWIHVSLITEKRNRFWKFLKLSFFHCPDQYFMSKTKEKKEKVCSTILLVKEKNYSHLSWKVLLPDECGHF